MFFNETYTTEEVNSAPSYSLVPRGEYIAQIEKWELKDNKNGGNRISCQVRILDGDFTNKVLFTDITMENANQQAAEIGKKHRAQIANAIGNMQPRSPDDWLNIPLVISVTIQKSKNPDYPDDKNAIQGYKPVAGHAPQAQAPAFSAQPQQRTQQPAQPPAGAPKWARQ